MGSGRRTGCTVKPNPRDYDGHGAVDGERGILHWGIAVKSPVRACHLFRDASAVYLSASSLNASWRVYYTAYHPQPDRVLVRPILWVLR